MNPWRDVVPWSGVALAATVLAAGSTAQTTTIGVPSLVGSRDAVSIGDFAGFDARQRQQVLVRESVLRAARGRELLGLWVRRDHALGLRLPAARSRIRLSLSKARTSPADPSPSFAANRGASPVVVFAGVIQLPASGRVTKTIPWDATHAVRIVFQTPYRYGGGTLCLEVEGEPLTPGAFWPVDWEHEAPHGSVQPFGQACGLPAQRFRNPAGLWNRFTVPGGTMPISAMGRAGTPAVLVLSARRLASPIDLSPLGATGCKLHVPPDVALSATHDLPDTARVLAKARLDLRLPAGPSMLAARLYAQWANLETGGSRSNRFGLTTTNALRIDLAGSLPPGRIGTVVSAKVPPRAPYPPRGRVEVGRGPVLRFELR